MVLLARNRAAFSVTRGENEGRYLPHVAVASKFTTVTPIRIPHIDKVTHLVTDRTPPAALRKALRARKVRILTA